MASSGRIVKKVCYPSLKTVVFYNNKSVVLVEVVFHIKVEVMGCLLGNNVIIVGILGNFYS